MAAVHLESGLSTLGFPITRTRLGAVADAVMATGEQLTYRLFPSLLRVRPVEQRETLLTMARAATRLGELYYFSNEPERTLQTVLRTLNLAEKAGRSPLLSESSASVAVMCGAAGLGRFGEYYNRRALGGVHDHDDATSCTKVIGGPNL